MYCLCSTTPAQAVPAAGNCRHRACLLLQSITCQPACLPHSAAHAPCTGPSRAIYEMPLAASARHFATATGERVRAQTPATMNFPPKNDEIQKAPRTEHRSSQHISFICAQMRVGFYWAVERPRHRATNNIHQTRRAGESQHFPLLFTHALASSGMYCVLSFFLIVPPIRPIITICLHGFQRQTQTAFTFAHVLLSSNQKLIVTIKIYLLQTHSIHVFACDIV